VRPKLILSLAIGIASAMAAAQNSVTLMFPNDGEREVWVGIGLPSAAPSDVIKTGSANVEVPVAGRGAGDTIFAWDRTTGNLASKTVGEVKKMGTWSVTPTAFTDIAEVKVRVEHGGKAVAAAEVSLNDGRRTQSQLLDPSSRGEVTFFAVKPGQLKATVKYKSEGKMASPVTQILEAPKGRPDAVPTLTISLPQPVATVDPAPAAPPVAGSATKAASSEEASKGQPANPIGSLLVYLLGFGVAVGAAYFVMQYMKKNQETVTAKLEQLGVQVPKPDDEPLPDPIAPSAPAKPAPPEKIILGDAAPDPIAPVAASTAVIEPRLVSEAGDAMPLPSGEIVVGREVGLDLSLVGETTVSRRHAQLVRNGNEVILRDMGSTNGTYVNGQPVQGDATLRSGDVVQFGSVRFRFES